jgi:hypothetical protein
MTVATNLSEVDIRWSTRKLKEWDSFVWRADRTSVWVQKSGDDWMIAGNRDDDDSENTIGLATSLPISVDWQRWTGFGERSTVRFNPAFPDRPLVVKTRAPVMIPSDQTVDLFLNIPIWVEVCVEEGELSDVLGLFPSKLLSNTWFGDQFEGELCYALKSLARRTKDDLKIEPLAATCRFSITNRFEKPLPLDRIRVLPRHLSIYKSRRRLWTSPIIVVSHGPDQPSHLSYPEEPHEEALSVLELVRPPEEVYRPSFFRESFAQYTRALFE